jgi:hypothetical protein
MSRLSKRRKPENENGVLELLDVDNKNEKKVLDELKKQKNGT